MDKTHTPILQSLVFNANNKQISTTQGYRFQQYNIEQES